MKDLSDFEIIESVIKGNTTDFALLVDRYKNKAFSLLKRMLKNEFEAEEVLQDCFLKAYNGLKNFKREAKFSTWFYRIVYNSALTKISNKKRKIESEMNSVEDHIELKSTYDGIGLEEQNLSAIINDLIEQLPEKHASVLNMFYLQGMSCTEISEVMNLSVSNVKVLLHRSRNELRNYLIKNKLVEELM